MDTQVQAKGIKGRLVQMLCPDEAKVQIQSHQSRVIQRHNWKSCLYVGNLDSASFATQLSLSYLKFPLLVFMKKWGVLLFVSLLWEKLQL